MIYQINGLPSELLKLLLFKSLQLAQNKYRSNIVSTGDLVQVNFENKDFSLTSTQQKFNNKKVGSTQDSTTYTDLASVCAIWWEIIASIHHKKFPELEKHCQGLSFEQGI